ncbi:FKBP-type peptidyl-prolyl cis-trans isomerase [Leucobacter sp. GX24907]
MNSVKRTRALLAIAAATTLLLTACSGSSSESGLSEDAAGVACTTGGTSSEAVTVSGDFGEELELTSETPVSSKELERTVMTEGAGKALEEGDTISASMTTFNGASGDVIQHVPASELELTKDSLNSWAYEAMRCAQPDQRVALVVPAADVLGGASPEEAGVPDMTADDSFVIVMDFAEIETCETMTPRDEKYPDVETFEDKAPEIEIPSCMEAPEKLEVDVLQEGDGAEVQPGDEVTVNYRGVIWRTGQEFDSSWSRGEPAKFTTDGVIGGFQKALEGQKVGSTIMSIVPAEDGGYGAEGLQSQGHEPDDVMVFVLDIVDTSSAE